MNPLKRADRIIKRITNLGSYISAGFMILIVILILVEIFLRSVFKTSTLISDEFSAYFFVAVVMLGLAYTFKEEGHIRITLILSRLSPRYKRIFDIADLAVALMITGFVFYHSLMMVIETWKLGMRADSIVETPIYIPQIVIPIGFFIFFIQIGDKIIRGLKK